MTSSPLTMSRARRGKITSGLLETKIGPLNSPLFERASHAIFESRVKTIREVGIRSEQADFICIGK